jgi:hypothetical protein
VTTDHAKMRRLAAATSAKRCLQISSQTRMLTAPAAPQQRRGRCPTAASASCKAGQHHQSCSAEGRRSREMRELLVAVGIPTLRSC